MHVQYKIILNYFLFFMLFLLAVIIQSAFFNMYFILFFAPDLLIIFVIYIGFRRELMEGMISVALLGYVYHLHSSISSRLIVFIFLLCFIVTRYIRMTFYVRTGRSLFIMIMSMVFFYKILLAFWAYVSDAAFVFRIIFLGFLSSFLTAIVGVLFFKLFTWIDIKTNREELQNIKEG